MMTKFTLVLSTLLLGMTSINAQRGGSGPRGVGRPAGRPAPGLAKGIFGTFAEDTLVDLSSCPVVVPAEPACALRNGEAGTWLCRTIAEPLTGDSESWSTCANATRALPVDECGCCGECPSP